MARFPLYACTVALAGSVGHVVPKHGITAAEIAILRDIHSSAGGGNEAVSDVRLATERVAKTNSDGDPLVRGGKVVYEDEPVPMVLETSERELREKLIKDYDLPGRPDVTHPVKRLFPGNSRLYATVDELDLPPECFAVKERETAESVAAPLKNKGGRAAKTKVVEATEAGGDPLEE